MKRTISFELTQAATGHPVYSGVIIRHAGLPDVAVYRPISEEQAGALAFGPMPRTLRVLADLLEGDA